MCRETRGLKRMSEQVSHRLLVGGMWDEIGDLQSRFLRSEGLLPHHNFLDVGCGALRAGVKLVPYLERGRYFGIDVSASLIEAGKGELALVGCADRVPDANFRTTGSFDIGGFPQFDVAIAQSVFTHLPIAQFTACLSAMKPHFDRGRLFATFFIAPADAPSWPQGDGVITYPNRDPFHTTVDEIVDATKRAGWTCRWIGNWKHPRGQQIGEFAVIA